MGDIKKVNIGFVSFKQIKLVSINSKKIVV